MPGRVEADSEVGPVEVGSQLERAGDLRLPGSLQGLYNRGRLTATRLILDDPDISFADFAEIFHDLADFRLALGKLRDMAQFWAGDLMLAGESLFGEPAYQAFTALGVPEGALQDWLRVARLVLPAQRRAELRWSHHRAVASRPADEQARLLQVAIDERLTVVEFREYLRDLGRGLSQARADSRTRTASGVVVDAVFEAARNLLRSAECRGAFSCQVPTERVQRLREALGEEDG